MQHFRSDAIIMRVKEYREADLSVTFLTRDKGLLRGTAKGGRKSTRRFVNCLETFSLVLMDYHVKTEGKTYFLDSCRLVDPFPGIRENFESLSLASYVLELLEVLFPMNVSEPRAFDLAKATLGFISRGGDLRKARILFEGHIMALGGYAIELNKCAICGRRYTGKGDGVILVEKGKLSCLKCSRPTETHPLLPPIAISGLRAIQGGAWETLRHLDLSPQDLKWIGHTLKLHVAYRIGKRFRSAKYLQ